MSLFMKDPKTTAALILSSGEKKPQTPDGAEKDNAPANEDYASKLLQAFQSNDSKSLMSNLRSIFNSFKDESTDNKPSVPTERV